MGDSKPPSRRRYEEENPTVSFRISKEHKEELDEIAEHLEMTKKEWLESVIDEDDNKFSAVFEQGRTKGEREGYDNGYTDGHEEGRKEAYQEFVATVPCADCGKPVPVNTKSRKTKLYDAIENVNAEWTARPPPETLKCKIRHGECPEE